MSYMRFSLREPQCDVYCFESTAGDWECCCCWFGPPDFYGQSAEELFWHVVAHELAGHRVNRRGLWALALEAIDSATAGRG